ncbi:pas sensor diguanylate cyclase/phosphodiesterase [Heliomicrobium modesticaldum Ice1]|uniref:Pas sensor diguanylate cyclase/phosphodiesterase n=1 Tax=Heliobacterium modesticaldum (strain ATCC 51547 / Ice1) TaxID=498761 RepID=B0TEB0_HELMI|nr:EAL domain-containing protein [Heliomicrobium modesticaldum]ABZ85592.1 pas sensor diguanylate cyclase/phosphodiesterase [Heliomicrobium modesticaldum Ice1]
MIEGKVNKGSSHLVQFAEEELRAIQESTFDAIFTCSLDGVLTGIWPGAARRNSHLDGLLGCSLNDVVHPEDLETVKAFISKVKRLGTVRPGPECRLRQLDGSWRWYSVNASLVCGVDGEPLYVAGVARDLSEQKETEKHLKHLATHDYLTGIPNRYYFDGALSRARRLAKEGTVSSLLLIDVDKFNLVNDLLDHDMGDRLLTNLSRLLKSQIRRDDVLARLSGDEFGLLLHGMAEAEAEKVALNLCHIVKERDLCPVLEGCDLRFTVSIGVAEINGHQDVRQVLSRAGAALHMAKMAGRSQVVVAYANERMFSRLEETSRLIQIVRGADREGRFQLFFMPVVRSSDGAVEHYEALLRLRDGDGKLIPPATFIPVAESFGLMGDIERWVVAEAVRFLVKNPQLRLYVNLSGESLGDKEILNFIEEIVQTTPAIHGRLGFEITETAAVRDLMSAEQWVQKLRSLGCRFALDDFGSGYSSFAYLNKLPVDFIKIDGSFVRSIDHDPERHALVKGINQLVHSLGKRTISEYVENDRIWRLIREMGIEYGQGYYLGEPSPLPQDMASESTELDPRQGIKRR